MDQQHQLCSLHLFAGAGGGLLADLLLGHRIIGAVENDAYCQRVLMQRQADGLLPWFPIWDDVTTFDGHPWHGLVDVVHAGFPCQPWSVAGQRAGEQDERNLWSDTYRILCEVRPRYAFFENVPGLLVHPYLRRILADLAQARYDAVWCALGADDVGANHRRKRLWILAYDTQRRWRTGGQRRSHPGDQGECQYALQATDTQSHIRRTSWHEGPKASDRGSKEMGDTAEFRCDGVAAESRSVAACQEERGMHQLAGASWWQSEPAVGRVAHGVVDRVGKLRALGNGQVPLCAATAWCLLIQQAWERLTAPKDTPAAPAE